MIIWRQMTIFRVGQLVSSQNKSMVFYISVSHSRIIKMIKLFIHLHSVSFRLRQEATICCLFKKDHQERLYPETSTLKNGLATFTKHFQLLIDQKNPILSLQIIICYGNMKKLGGICTINLRQWYENSTNYCQYSLEKCADKKALLKFQFLYVKVDNVQSCPNLLTYNEYSAKLSRDYLCQRNEENNCLVKQNNKLSSQIKGLIDRNNALHEQQGKIKFEYELEKKKHQEEMKRRNDEIQQSQHHLCQIKNRFERMREVVENSGENELKAKMEGLFQCPFGNSGLQEEL